MTEFEARFIQNLHPGITLTKYEIYKYLVKFSDGYSAYTFDEAFNYLSENYTLQCSKDSTNLTHN